MLADVLKEQGRRPSWVAEKLGVKRATVTLWSQGKREIPDRRVEELARLLGVPEDSIRGEGDSPTSAHNEQAPAPARGGA